MGLPRQEYWSGLPFPTPGDLPNPGLELASPALAGGFFTTEPQQSQLKKKKGYIVFICLTNIYEYLTHFLVELFLSIFIASLMAQMVKNLHAMQETPV